MLALRSEFAAEEDELQRRIAEARARQETLGKDLAAIAASRGDGAATPATASRRGSRARRRVEAGA